MQKEHQPYNIQPADRLANVSEYYFSRKLKEVAQMNAEGKNVISLGIGSPDMPPSEETVNVLCEQAKRPDAHGYQPTVGIPELRKAMADWYKRWYHVELDPATEIQPLIGSKEGILHVTLALVNPGDQVLVPNPGYPTYTSLNKILGSEIVNYNLREDNHWQPDFDELEKMDLSRVKIMWTNYPNMPTGANATMELYEKLVNFARRHNIVIVNDNPYSFILNKKPLSILNVPGAKECCIEFNSMSKSHNMPGWRVGMLATNAQFIQWILKIKSNIDSGTFRPMQLAAAQAYNNSVEWHEEANVNVYSRRRQLAEEIMKVLGCSFDPNQVGMFLWGRIPDSYNDVEELTEKVLHEARVFITPGFIFGSNGKRYIRISLCAKEDKTKYQIMELDLKPIELPGIEKKRPMIIAGPCSAETEEQVMDTATMLANKGIKIFRAGIWKPRTKPGGFEGIGVDGLAWLKRVKQETGMYVATEVATAKHVYECLKAGIDVLWIGARTTANPFAVQEIADALKGVDIPILIKNPVNPDLELWIGAFERINNAGLKQLGAIHRGFSSYDKKIYRNLPQWYIPIELRRRIPELPIFCDPSHIGGKRELVAPLCQQAMDLGFDGLIVESHCNPDCAWSDAAQQVTPDVLDYILNLLVIRKETQTTENLGELRNQIDDCDNEIIEVLAKRMRVCREIGTFKKEHDMTILQTGRYNEILDKRGAQGSLCGMDSEFIKKVFEAIHEESVRQQMEIINK